MAKPFGVGDVVGGRYRVTHHVVTSADQDIVFQATDEALSREVSVLLASRSNAKQVATSARELAAGERASEVEVLDLGLAEDRTYLISTLVDPNQLLDLVVPDVAPFVEPYFTDSLGSEIFGQSREMQPQTYEDDAEYYARLHETPDAPAPEWAKKKLGFGARGKDKAAQPSRPRPAFLDGAQPAPAAGEGAAEGPKAFAPELGLLSDLDVVDAPAEKDTEETLEAAYRPEKVGSAEEAAATSSNVQDAPDAEEEAASGTIRESAPSQSISALPASTGAAPSPLKVDELVAEGEEVIDNPPEQPEPAYSTLPHSAETPGQSAGEDKDSSFASLITGTPKGSPANFPGAGSSSARPRRATNTPAAGSTFGGAASLTPAQMISAGVLIILVLLASIIIFSALGG